MWTIFYLLSVLYVHNYVLHMIHIYLIPYDLCLIIYIIEVWPRRPPVNIILTTAWPFWLPQSDDDLEMVNDEIVEDNNEGPSDISMEIDPENERELFL